MKTGQCQGGTFETWPTERRWEVAHPLTLSPTRSPVQELGPARRIAYEGSKECRRACETHGKWGWAEAVEDYASELRRENERNVQEIKHDIDIGSWGQLWPHDNFLNARGRFCNRFQTFCSCLKSCAFRHPIRRTVKCKGTYGIKADYSLTRSGTCPRTERFKELGRPTLNNSFPRPIFPLPSFATSPLIWTPIPLPLPYESLTLRILLPSQSQNMTKLYPIIAKTVLG